MSRALWSILASLSSSAQIQSIALDGTSSTALLVDAASGEVLQPPKMYNDAQPAAAAAAAARMAPQGHTASSSTSTLAKLISWQDSGAMHEVCLHGLAALVTGPLSSGHEWLQSRERLHRSRLQCRLSTAADSVQTFAVLAAGVAQAIDVLLQTSACPQLKGMCS